jgi:response regulator RpfG family c-di-GMP phosphodiesterase
MSKLKKPSKILYTVLATLVLVSMLPVIIVGWQLIELNQDTLRGNEQRIQLDSVADKAEQIKLFVNAYRDQLQIFARSLELVGGITESLEQNKLRDTKLSEILQNDKNFCALVLTPIDPNKLGLTTFAHNSNKISVEEMSQITAKILNQFRQTPSRNIHISKPEIIKSSNESAIVLAVPIIAENSATPTDETATTTPEAAPLTIEGSIIAVVNLDSVFNFVTKVTKNNSGLNETNALLRSGRTIYFVTDNSGKVIAHPDQQVVFTDATSARKNLPVIGDWLDNPQLAGGTGSFKIEDSNKKLPILSTYTTADIAPDQRLGIFAMVNEDAAYFSVGQMIAKTILVSVITILAAVIIGIFLAIRITSPIETLALGARSIATGDFTRRIRVSTRSEIGQLADDFNRMANYIQQYTNELRLAAEENRMLFIGTVRALAEAIDGKDAYTRGHSERVMKYSVLMAQHMNLSEEEIEDIRIAGILHDVGKIGIDDKILKKPAALTDDEYHIMKQHPQIGAKIMSEIPQMKRYIPGMFYHHECLDGKGYPLGLKGDQIPMMARIISVADVFDAMTTNRPYQRAMDTQVAVEKIRSFVGTRYDSQVVEALVGALQAGKLDEVIQSYASTLVKSQATK